MSEVVQLDYVEAEKHLEKLIALLQDSVESGASIGFWHPLSVEHAREFWEDVFSSVKKGNRILLVSREGNEITGTVQLDLARKPNATHRAEVQKLLVHTTYRGKGLGKTLLKAIEDKAREHGRKLLVLDTKVGEPSEQLYIKYGYQSVGIIPNFVIEPDDKYYGTHVFYRWL
jgi:GNAT superfamily N-acetyltransferase